MTQPDVLIGGLQGGEWMRSLWKSVREDLLKMKDFLTIELDEIGSVASLLRELNSLEVLD